MSNEQPDTIAAHLKCPSAFTAALLDAKASGPARPPVPEVCVLESTDDRLAGYGKPNGGAGPASTSMEQRWDGGDTGADARTLAASGAGSEPRPRVLASFSGYFSGTGTPGSDTSLVLP
jgi:hypothetical protein